MTIKGGELMIEAVVQMIDSTVCPPVLFHLHEVPAGSGQLEWRREQEGRYVFEDYLKAAEAAPILLQNERDLRRAEVPPRPCDRLNVYAMPLDNRGAVKREVPGVLVVPEPKISRNSHHRPKREAGEGRPAGARAEGSSGTKQSRPSPARAAKRLESAPESRVPAADGPDKWAKTFAEMERRGLA